MTMTQQGGGGLRAPQKPIPERIREAREARGFMPEDFANELGVTRAALAQYETGQIAPSAEVMSRIISLTAQPHSFFTMPRARGADGLRPFWRSLKRMEIQHRRRVARRMEWAFDIAQYVGRFIDLPPVNLPALAFDYASATEEDIERAAEAVRDHWKLGHGPVRELSSQMEVNGIALVCERVACDDMDAVSCWQGGRPFVMYAQETESGPRQAFNLAHELGHLVMHAGVDVTFENIEKIERQANRFAGAFLLPRERFSREVLGNSISYFTSLKSRWGVAIAAMAYRCKDLGIFSPNQQSYLMRQLNARRLREVEPLDDAFPMPPPTMLGDSIKMLIQHGVQTRDQIEASLGLNLEDVESLSGVSCGFLGNKVVQLRLTPRTV